MSFPSTFDIFSGTTAQGTSLLVTPDHAADHRTLGSAAATLENKLGLGTTTPSLNTFLLGGLGTSSSWGTAGTALTFINSTFNNGALGTPAITGGTSTAMLNVTRMIGSAAYSGTVSGTSTLNLATATRHFINMPNSAGLVTLAVSNGVVNAPFIVEIKEGTAGLGTIGWFAGITWSNGGVVGTLTTTASKVDTYGFLPNSGTTFYGFIVGTSA